MTQPRRARLRDRGFALLVVLWTLVLVSLLVLQLSEAGSAEARLGSNLRRAAVAGAAADGALAEAAFRLMDRSPGGWGLAGGRHVLSVAGGSAQVTVENEGGRVDLNNASPQVMAGLLQTEGLDPTRAAELVEQIAAWHTNAGEDQRRAIDAPYLAAHRTLLPPLAPFQSVEELGLVLGMTPELLHRLLPHLTVYGNGDPVMTLADPVVRRALASAGVVQPATAQGPDASLSDTVRITVTATVGGGRAVREAVVQLEPGEDQQAYRVLRIL